MYTHMQAYRSKLLQEAEQYRAQLKTLPKGKLICTHDGRHTKWYVRRNDKTEYLSKKKRSLAEKLAARRFCQEKIDHLQKEIAAIDRYLKHSPITALQKPDSSEKGGAALSSGFDPADRMLAPESAFCDLLAPYFKSKHQLIADWLAEPYEHSCKYPDGLTQQCPSGHTVRSKSEQLIDYALYERGLAFRYECGVDIDGVMFYPDFMILHPVTGKIILWEHCGMMDDPAYVEKFLIKLQAYIAAGYIPSVNLIFTFETEASPLTMKHVQDMIEMYLS